MAKRDQVVAVDVVPVIGVVDVLLGIPEQASADELTEIGLHAFNAAGYQMARAGAAFRALAKRFATNSRAIAEEHGISHAHVQNAIQLADYLDSRPDAEARRMLAVPYTKVLAIAKADPEVVAELLAEGALDGDEALSVRELRERLKKSNAVNATTATKNERLEAEIEKVKARFAHRLIAPDLPEFTYVVRQEASALTEAMTIALDGLEGLFRDTLAAPHDDVPDAERHEAAAAGTFFHNLRGAWARAGLLLEQLDQHYPDVCDKAAFNAQLGPGEAEAFKHAREQILRRIKTAADNRAAERHNAKGGRGRPRAVKAVD